jgi:lipoprotein-anchoring transpeptidase ErfK/SrfK
MVRASMPFVQRLAVAFFLAAAPAIAVQARELDPAPTVSPALRPGQFVWHPDSAPAGPIAILVSLPLQRAFVFRGGTLIGLSTLSSGRPGYDTPVGAFTILQKEVDHKSSLYDDAPMPYMQRLTWDGVALHAGKISGQPESHGCIRLPATFAKKLFEATALGAAVIVTDEAPGSIEEAAALASPPDTDAIASAR